MKAQLAFVLEQLKACKGRSSQEQAALVQSSVSDTSLSRRIDELQSHCNNRVTNDKLIRMELENLKSRKKREQTAQYESDVRDTMRWATHAESLKACRQKLQELEDSGRHNEQLAALWIAWAYRRNAAEEESWGRRARRLFSLYAYVELPHTANNLG